MDGITTSPCEFPAKRSRFGPFVAVAIGLALIAPAARAAGFPGLTLRAGGIATDYEKRGGISYGTYVSRLDLGGGSGPYAAAELRLHWRFGIELSAARLDLDAHYRVSRQVPISFDPFILGEELVYEADGKYTLKPLALAALFHLFSGRKVDVYLGPQVARVSFANDLAAGTREPEMAFGGKAGLEVRFGDGPWAAAAEIGRLEIQHESTDHDLYGNLGVSTASVLLVFHAR